MIDQHFKARIARFWGGCSLGFVFLAAVVPCTPFAEIFRFDEDPIPVENFSKFRTKDLKAIHQLVHHKANVFCETQQCTDPTSQQKRGCNGAGQIRLVILPEVISQESFVSEAGLHNVEDLYFLSIECRFTKDPNYFSPATDPKVILKEFDEFLGVEPAVDARCGGKFAESEAFASIDTLAKSLNVTLEALPEEGAPPLPPFPTHSRRESRDFSRDLRRGPKKKPGIPPLKPGRFRVYRPPLQQPVQDARENAKANAAILSAQFAIREERDQSPLWPSMLDLTSAVTPREDRARVSEFLERGSDGNVYLHYVNESISRRLQVRPADFLWVMAMNKQIGLTTSGIPFNVNAEYRDDLWGDFLMLFPEIAHRKIELSKRSDEVWELAGKDLAGHPPDAGAKTAYLDYSKIDQRGGGVIAFRTEAAEVKVSPRELYFLLAHEMEFGVDQRGNTFFLPPEVQKELREDFAKLYPGSFFSQKLEESKKLGAGH